VTPLHAAASQGHHETVVTLLDAGAAVDTAHKVTPPTLPWFLWLRCQPWLTVRMMLNFGKAGHALLLLLLLRQPLAVLLRLLTLLLLVLGLLWTLVLPVIHAAVCRDQG
jgi:ankyrin repeat protein